ncbi:MAG: phosphate acyltransferase [candidate division Zixibacteria bacterium]|nr:phosphate acyltransferase [candidate division Zixibacteria bacterium]
MIKSSQEIIRAAKKLSAGGVRRRVAVAVAQDPDVLEAMQSAHEDGICDGSLFGDETKIRELAEKNDVSLDGLEIINLPDANQAVMAAVEMADSGKADAIMKGFVPTSTLLKGVLDRRFNLRAGPTLSHVAVIDIPDYHKLLLITDGGMVVKPTLEQKFDILKNALIVAHALGIDPAKVALSAAGETAVPAMPQAEEAAALMRKVVSEKTVGCEIAGPIGFDLAVSAEVAGRVGYAGPVAGDADIFLTGTIEECNITVKTLIIFARAVFAGVIVGARVPVSLVSRTDPVIGKKTSLALACLISEYYRRTGKGGESHG